MKDPLKQTSIKLTPFIWCVKNNELKKFTKLLKSDEHDPCLLSVAGVSLLEYMVSLDKIEFLKLYIQDKRFNFH